MEPIDQIGRRAGRRALADAAAYVDVEQGLELVKAGDATVRPQPLAKRSPARLALAAVASLVVLAGTGAAILVLQNTNDTGTDTPPADNQPPGPPGTNTGEDPSTPSDTSSPTTPTSTPTTTTGKTQSTTTGTNDGNVPQGLQNWPPRSQDPVAIDEVPALLPTQSVPNATVITRWVETGDGSGFYDYTQTWFDAGRDGYLIVTTNIDQDSNISEEFRTPIDTSTWETEWDTAFLVQTATDAYTHLQLAGPGGYVQLSALHLDRTKVVDIARTMRRRPPPEPGWELPSLPGDFRPFAESGDALQASRQLLWRGNDGSLFAELTVATEHAGAVTMGWSEDAIVDIIDLDGTPAVVTESSGRVAISWPLDDDTVAFFGFAGDRQTTESIVRGLEVVDGATWRNATEPRDPQADGCQSLFC